MTAGGATSAEPVFEHDAFLYADDDELRDGVAAFVRDGLARDEDVMVALSASSIDNVRGALGAAANKVSFVDMAVLGVNPARILPAWREFVDRSLASGRVCRGVGEPIWPGRRPAEIAECQLHELLLNDAFGSVAWRLLCPYDGRGLSPAVLDGARHSHAFLHAGGTRHRSARFAGWPSSPATSAPATSAQATSAPATSAQAVFGQALPNPVKVERTLAFAAGDLGLVRDAVTEFAHRHGLDQTAAAEVELAVHEVATNSVRHGGGRGELRLWREGGCLLFDVTDAGYVADLFVGRCAPAVAEVGGRGLWLANQLCELVQVRSSAAGTVVRLHRWLAATGADGTTAQRPGWAPPSAPDARDARRGQPPRLR